AFKKMYSSEELNDNYLREYDRDFKDEMFFFEKSKKYYFKVLTNGEHFLSSFDSVILSLEITYPPPYLANMTVSAKISLVSINGKYVHENEIGYYKNLSILNTPIYITIPPSKLRNISKKRILIEIENESLVEEYNLSYEVKVYYSKYSFGNIYF